MKTRFLKTAHWAKALYHTHQEALLIAGRVGLSATLAYLIAVLQHLPETYWPVMSAVIVARGGAKGAGGSASDRLIGTLSGAAVGLGASFLHHFGIPDWALLFLAMAPMAFLSADNSAFRAAPMAAMIVLSATASGKTGWFGLGVAGLRVLDVGMGTLVALFVSYVVLRSDAMKGLRQDAAALMMPLANLLSLAAKPDGAAARDKFARLNAKTRREMRELVIAARQIKAKRSKSPPPPFAANAAAGVGTLSLPTPAAELRPAGEGRDLGETLPNQFTAALGRAHGTIVFVARALAGAPLAEDVAQALRPFVRDARARLGAIHHFLADGTPLDGADALEASTVAASARIERCAAARPAVHLEALPFLLQTLRDDLNELAGLAEKMSGPPKTRSVERALPLTAENQQG